MIASLFNLFFVASVQQPTVIVKKAPHPCTLSRDNLSIEGQIEMAIGCSERKKKTVYERDALEEIYKRSSRAN